MPRKKPVRDEKRLDILIRKREHERKRLAKIKSDPISAAQLKEKEHLKYLKKKEKGKIKLINDLSIREQRKQRRLWRVNQRRLRAKMKIKPEDSHVPASAENKILGQPWSSTIVTLEQQETLTSTKTQPVTNINAFKQPELSTSIKLKNPQFSISTKILEQPETLTKSRFYIRSKDESQPVPLKNIELEKSEFLKSTQILEQQQFSTNTMVKQPRLSTNINILEQPQPLTKNNFYIRSKDKLPSASPTITNVFCQPQPSTCTKIFRQSKVSTRNKILEQPQPTTNANIFNIFGKLPAKNTMIFEQPQQITKNRFYIRTKDETLTN